MLCRTNSRPPSRFSPIAGRVFPSSQRHGGDPLRGHEREEPVGQARVDRHVREAHRHRVLELIVHDRLPDLPRRRVDDQDEAGERRQRLLRGEVEHPVAVGILRSGRVQEADAELGAQAPEAREEAARRSRQGLGRVAHVDLVQRGRVDPELLAVGDDLLRRRLLVLPAELAALLEIDRALRRDRLIEALVERRLGELGAEVDHAAVRALEVADDVVQRRRRPGGRSREDEARDDKGTRVAHRATLHYSPRAWPRPRSWPSTSTACSATGCASTSSPPGASGPDARRRRRLRQGGATTQADDPPRASRRRRPDARLVRRRPASHPRERQARAGARRGEALPRRLGVQLHRRPRDGAKRRAHRPAHARAVRADLVGVGHLLTAVRARPTIPLRNGWAVTVNHRKEIPMKRLLRSLLTLGIVGVASAPGATANDGFTNADVRGPYGFSLDGTIVSGTTAVPVAAVGVFEADGNGSLPDGVRTLSAGGVVRHQTFTCTYTVNPNGTGSAVCTILTGGTGTESFDFVLTDKRREVPFVATNPGFVVRGVSVKQ